MGVSFVGMERLQNHSIAVLILPNRIIHERGLNENHNGLLRQYFPKKSLINTLATEVTRNIDWFVRSVVKIL